jgi:MoxR-like ATPase
VSYVSYVSTTRAGRQLRKYAIPLFPGGKRGLGGVGGLLTSIADTMEALEAHGYIAERELATSVFLARRLQRPLLLEGEAGVGKTELARVLAAVLDAPLIRLQCYEGLDASQALYDWDYARQMLEIRLLEAGGERDTQRVRREIFGPAFLIRRPLLQAIDPADPAHSADPADSAADLKGGRVPVLLIDEIDRADEEFEAFLLELLGDWQVTIPEVGTIRAKNPPVVIITSNRTREIHDALKRRCLYLWIPTPTFDKELRIVRRKAPQATEQLSRQIVAFVQALRGLDLYKPPGVAETLDWTAALLALDTKDLGGEQLADTLGALVKHQDDVALARTHLDDLVARARA